MASFLTASVPVTVHSPLVAVRYWRHISHWHSIALLVSTTPNGRLSYRAHSATVLGCMCGWGTDDSDTHGACNGLVILAGGAADCTSHNYTDPFVWVPAILVMDGMGSMCQFPLSLITVIVWCWTRPSVYWQSTRVIEQ